MSDAIEFCSKCNFPKGSGGFHVCGKQPKDDRIERALNRINEYMIDLKGHIEQYTESINGKTVLDEMSRIQNILEGK